MKLLQAQDTFNCASRVQTHLRESGKKSAFWNPKLGFVSYSEFGALCAKAQKGARVFGLSPGRPVLLLARPGVELYAAIYALIGLRIPVLFLEPWLPVAQISSILRKTRPQTVLTESGMAGWLARAWGMRLSSGDLPKDCEWISLPRFLRESLSATDKPVFEEAPATELALMAFSSGTKGAPKGVLRSHLALWNAHEIIRDCAKRWRIDDSEADLCIFPNLPLYNVNEGRTSVLLLDQWSSPEKLNRWKDLPPGARPSSIACGPAVLKALAGSDAFSTLDSIKLGGAVSDCSLVEQAFAKWPEAKIFHVYGSSEAEPISVADARDALKYCAEREAFQMTYIGRPIQEIESRLSKSVLWIRGPHVFSDRTEDWWCTDDRVSESPVGWWYGGRSFQSEDDFGLEQRIYSYLRQSRCFIHRDSAMGAHLIGEIASDRVPDLLKKFPELRSVRANRLVLDRRHRARIDRVRSVPKELRVY